MSSEGRIEFTKENLDFYLKEIAKAYRKLVGKKMPAELILIGGASVLINYGFRNMTTDIDALIQAASGMKDAINSVGDRFGLSKDWLNADFKKTDSYTPKIMQYSKYYRTFSNVLTIRTVSAEYLIAMKLRSGRQYKNDLSDVIGILFEHEHRGEPISMDQIQQAVCDLYGGWDVLPDQSKAFIENVMRNGDLEQMHTTISKGEKEARRMLIDFEQNYPGVTTSANVNEILDSLKKRTKS